MAKLGFDYQCYFYCGLYGIAVSVFIRLQRDFRIITEALQDKILWVHITNVAPGDFATNIAAGRFHAPVIKGSAYETSYGNIENNG
jgi:hypothetical protein